MTRGDKGKLFILFVPLFTLPLLNEIVCSLWWLHTVIIYGVDARASAMFEILFLH